MRKLIGTSANGRYVSLSPTTPVQAAAFREMLAAQEAPRALTDREFFEGRGTLADQLGSQLNMVVDAAKEQGFTPGPNDVYCEHLADAVGDPKAFVPPTGGYNHVAKVQAMRERRAIKALEASAGKKPKPNERLVQQKMRQAVAADPGKALLPKAELKAQVIAKHWR